MPPDTTQTVVPGVTTGTTPPFLPSQSGAGTVDDQTKRMLEMILRTATQRRFAGQPRPSAVPGRQDPFQPPSYMTSGPNPHAWGAQRLMYGIQSMMKNAVAHHKEEQVNKAMADWEYAQSALNEYYNAQASGDQAALATAQKKLDVVFGDPKKLKNMAKALNQDWLNPEKTTVYGEALKKVAANTQQKDSQKQQAKQGIMGMFKKLIGGQRQPRPQLSPEEQKRVEREIIEKAPTTVAGFDLNTLRTVADFEKAANAARAHYQVRQAADGTLEAFNPLNPNEPAIALRDQEGKPLAGKAPPKEGTLYTLNGMPQGVFHQGKAVYPGDPEWSERDQKIFDQGAFSAKEKQLLRVEPAIAAMVGDPPNPTDYKKGRSDPEYAKALNKWGQGVFAKEKEKAAATGEARAIAWNKYRGVEVMDDDGNVYFTTMGNAMDKGFSGAGTGIKLKSRNAQIADIETASGKERDAIMKVDKAFTPGQIAKLKLAMTTDDEGLAREELKALANENLTESQQDFVVWTNQLNERAMSLRGIAGVGNSAQDVRNAIRAMLPGIGSGSASMMKKQLDAFDQQVKVLKGGIARPGKAKPGAAGAGPNVIVVSPDDMKNP